jgi:hypothetical protein
MGSRLCGNDVLWPRDFLNHYERRLQQQLEDDQDTE